MAEMKFKINNKLEIISDEQYYLCDVQDAKDGHLAISIPIKESEYLPLRINQRIEVLYYDGSNIYKFSSIVVNRTKSNIPLIWIDIPEEDKIKKIQRRKFVRIPVLIDVRCAVINRDTKLSRDTLAGLKFLNGTLLDLSGGGVKLKTQLEVKRDDILAIILPVEEGIILVKGEIKRIVIDELGDKICGVNFFDLKMMDQDKIIKLVFSIMREQMKKGFKEE